MLVRVSGTVPLVVGVSSEMLVRGKGAFKQTTRDVVLRYFQEVVSVKYMTVAGRGVHRVLVGKPEGKRPLVRPRLRWEDNIRMNLQEVRGSCGDWMELAQDRDRWPALVSTVRNLRVPKMRGIS